MKRPVEMEPPVFIVTFYLDVYMYHISNFLYYVDYELTIAINHDCIYKKTFVKKSLDCYQTQVLHSSHIITRRV